MEDKNMAETNGNLPVLTARGKTIPEAWERALVETWENGIAVKTQYDKPGDPPSRDSTMVLVVEEPFLEPRIHKNFPAGLENLEIYRQEVVDGVHDYWINPKEGKWTYTYHQRLFSYTPIEDVMDGGKPLFKPVDQIKYIIDALSSSGHTRRAQGITWIPTADPKTDDPPCLQRVWCRLFEGKDGLVLNMNTHWRSRDAYKAAFMNIFAFTDLQRHIAAEISKKTKEKVSVGRYTDISDSFHIYGSYFGEFRSFLESTKQRPFESRVWDSRDEMIQSAFADGRKILENEKKTGMKGLSR
jgi:thymidylate synthase